MGQIHSKEFNSQSGSPEFPYILWNPNVYYGVHKNLPLIHYLGQMIPVLNLRTCFLRVHSVIIAKCRGEYRRG
jgi:hypothetical protein